MKQPSIGLFVGSLLLALASSGPAVGQSAPGADEIVRKLQPAPAVRPPGRYYIKVDEPSKPEPSRSINLYINFESKSDRLTTDGQIVLGNLALALLDSRLAKFRFLIAGHTDAVGGDAYNLTLSRRRAEAVKAFLTSKHGIQPGRLKVVGYGRTRLLDRANPTSGANRRVQIINQGAS